MDLFRIHVPEKRFRIYRNYKEVLYTKFCNIIKEHNRINDTLHLIKLNDESLIKNDFPLISSEYTIHLWLLEALFYNEEQDTYKNKLVMTTKDINYLIPLRLKYLTHLGIDCNFELKHDVEVTINRDYELHLDVLSIDVEKRSYAYNVSTSIEMIHKSAREAFFDEVKIDSLLVLDIFTDILDNEQITEEEFAYIKENCIKE